MRAIHFDKTLTYQPNYPEVKRPKDEILIRTSLAGICNTDLEIVRGYMGFSGVLGHEFVGRVVQAEAAPAWIGQRVVGEINAYCGNCATCLRGHRTHCPNRTTLGIDRRNGTMADYFSLPAKLLHAVPDNVPDEWAVFTEPLAAACEILEQIKIKPTDRVVVLGDGKLGLLIAQVLQLTGCELLLVGRHLDKLAILAERGVETALATDDLPQGVDIVVEATGNPAGFALARSLVRPRGTLILKSTYHGNLTLNMSMVVVDELTLLGSRCGPFASALRLLSQRLVNVEPLISAIYDLENGLQAFEKAAERGVLKVLLTME